MPINSSLFISGSVGAGGRNERQDVSAVQQRLNALMHAPRQPQDELRPRRSEEHTSELQSR